MTAPTALARLAAWSTSFASGSSPHAQKIAIHAIEDAVACTIAGAGDLAAAGVRSAIRNLGGGNATVFGGGRSNAVHAALANGTAAHALDFDDVLVAGNTHAGAVLTAALLALAEEYDRSGQEVVDAFIVGVQLQVALSRVMMPMHYLLGWHTTATIGCVGTAGACARLLGCDAHTTEHAMSLAVSMAGGMKVQFGTPAKPLQAGLSAQHAVQAVLLARAGLTGNSAALEGRLGLGELMGDRNQAPDWSRLDSVLAPGPLAIEGAGLMLKRYPCCGSNTRILDALLELRQREPFDAADVARVDAQVADSNVQNLMYPQPKNGLEGRFSLQYSVAVALAYNAVGLRDFIPGAVQRAELQPLMGLTHMATFGAATYPDRPDVRRPHQLRITLKDGRVLHHECANPKGTNSQPFEEADRRAKFEDCSAWILPAECMHAVRSVLAKIDRCAHLRDLTQLLNFEAGGDEGQRFAITAVPAKAVVPHW
ncbi:MAG: MmgE/PrpD family protein [Pseudomonadota bacterium]